MSEPPSPQEIAARAEAIRTEWGPIKRRERLRHDWKEIVMADGTITAVPIAEDEIKEFCGAECGV